MMDLFMITEGRHADAQRLAELCIESLMKHGMWLACNRRAYIIWFGQDDCLGLMYGRGSFSTAFGTPAHENHSSPQELSIIWISENCVDGAWHLQEPMRFLDIFQTIPVAPSSNLTNLKLSLPSSRIHLTRSELQRLLVPVSLLDTVRSRPCNPTNPLNKIQMISEYQS